MKKNELMKINGKENVSLLVNVLFQISVFAKLSGEPEELGLSLAALNNIQGKSIFNFDYLGLITNEKGSLFKNNLLMQFCKCMCL